MRVDLGMELQAVGVTSDAERLLTAEGADRQGARRRGQLQRGRSPREDGQRARSRPEDAIDASGVREQHGAGAPVVVEGGGGASTAADGQQLGGGTDGQQRPPRQQDAPQQHRLGQEPALGGDGRTDEEGGVHLVDRAAPVRVEDELGSMLVGERGERWRSRLGRERHQQPGAAGAHRHTMGSPAWWVGVASAPDTGPS
ncbi:MAG: hypothetical protein U0S48_15280 [Solirubrobacteraceae bacterium]